MSFRFLALEAEAQCVLRAEVEPMLSSWEVILILASLASLGAHEQGPQTAKAENVLYQF